LNLIASANYVQPLQQETTTLDDYSKDTFRKMSKFIILYSSNPTPPIRKFSQNISDFHYIMNFNSSKYISLFPESLLPDNQSPDWNNKADNAWQLTAATLVGLQTVPGLVILYGSMVKKKWAVNSAFMGLYAFSAVLVCWVLWAHQMAFGNKLLPFVGKPNFALTQKFLLSKASTQYYLPMADFVFYQFAFAAITIVLLAGSLLGRMNFFAWMLFVPMWLTFSYTIGAFTIWGNGFLEGKIIDYAGGFVIHLSSGVAGFTAAYWVIDYK
jgi:Amt family ammonium transporter